MNAVRTVFTEEFNGTFYQRRFLGILQMQKNTCDMMQESLTDYLIFKNMPVFRSLQWRGFIALATEGSRNKKQFVFFPLINSWSLNRLNSSNYFLKTKRTAWFVWSNLRNWVKPRADLNWYLTATFRSHSRHRRGFRRTSTRACLSRRWHSRRVRAIGSDSRQPQELKNHFEPF